MDEAISSFEGDRYVPGLIPDGFFENKNGQIGKKASHHVGERNNPL